MVEQCNETVEQWNSGTFLVEQCGGQWNSHGGTLWWNSGTVWWNSGTVLVEQCGGTVEQSWWNTVVEQWNIDGGTV